MASITDKLTRGTDSATGRPIIATLAAPGKVVGAPSITLSGSTNWSTTTPVYIALYTTTAAGIKDPTSQTDWKATLSGTTLSNMTLTGGTDRTYAAGAYVEITFTSAWAKDLYDALNTSMNADGSLKTTAVQTALGLGTSALNGWNALGYAPNTVVYNGNRSYTLTFNGVDLTPTLSAGMRLRTTRTVAAPTQSTSLNGTTQYYSKSSPAGMTFTDDFVAGAWVKLSSYPTGTQSYVISRYNGTSGWVLQILASGQVYLTGLNAGSTNYSQVGTYQSLPLNKWVHIAAQLDMSTFTASTTTSYIMLDGIDVPVSVTRGGTNPTSLINNVGNLEVGSANGGTTPFPGKIAQAFVTSAKVTQAVIQSNYFSQSISPTETSLISAYSFNNTLNDLNTTNANNLTANGSAVATATDSPFGGQAGGAISPTLDYAILQSAAFSTNTTAIVQVPEGCTIPTSGGVSAVVYSSNGKPYGMPTQRGKWRLSSLLRTVASTTSNATFGSFLTGGYALNIPVGEWEVGHGGAYYAGIDTYFNVSPTALTGLGASTGYNASPLQVRITPNAGQIVASAYVKNPFSLSAQTVFIMYTFGATTASGISGDVALAEIFAENAYL